MSQPKIDKSKSARGWLSDWIVYGVIRIVLAPVLALPYRWRIPFGGWVFANIAAPLAGYKRRIYDNLTMIMPEMPEAEKKRLTNAVPQSVGRSITELFSGKELVEVAKNTPFEGPGFAALEKARAEGRPSILISGHFGNYDIARGGLIARGFDVGGLYRPMNNPYFNKYYVGKISSIGKPLFSRGRKGMSEMIRFLKNGGTLAILIDQHMRNGSPLNFFGQTAYTALSSAQMALKYNADLIPLYVIRQPDGLSFKVVMDAPVPHTTPEEMTQALNDGLEAQVREHMDQWMWIHRRWKTL